MHEVLMLACQDLPDIAGDNVGLWNRQAFAKLAQAHPRLETST
jgi:hypothetical protein